MNPKQLNKLRIKHLKHGHPFGDTVPIDKLTSEKHPHTDKQFIYTVNIRTCTLCGLAYLDAGLESRNEPG